MFFDPIKAKCNLHFYEQCVARKIKSFGFDSLCNSAWVKSPNEQKGINGFNMIAITPINTDRTAHTRNPLDQY